MIITESFVFLNYPKTGSTFVREALREIYQKKQQARWSWLRRKRSFEMYGAPNVRDTNGARRGKPNPHGTYWQIPARAQHLPVYCVRRDPIKRMISGYFYADWKKPEVWRGEIKKIRGRFPEFPDLSLSAYVEYINEFMLRKLVIGDINFGFLATDFVHFFLNDAELGDLETIKFPNLEAVKDAMGDVRFLENDSLNDELSHMLITHGFTKHDVRLVQDKKKVNTSGSNKQKNNFECEAEVAQICRRDVALINYLSGHGDMESYLREVKQ